MAENSSNGYSNKAAAQQDGPAESLPARGKRRSPLPLALIAALFIVVPFLTWYGTWYGRALTDEEVGQYLSDESRPRRVQHALTQVAERIDKKDEGVKHFYPQLLKLAASPMTEFRLTVAWMMGKDNRSQEFHETLLRLLEDREPIVRRNAALSLLSFGDASGKREVRSMLQPYTVISEQEGKVASALPTGSRVAIGSLLARLTQAGGGSTEVRSPLPGMIKSQLKGEGADVARGEALCSIEPDSASVWEALRALYLIGDREDLPEVERFSRGAEGMPARVKEQAALTLKAIQGRLENSRTAGAPNQP